MKLKIFFILVSCSLFLNAKSIYHNTEFDHLFLKYGKHYNVNPIILKAIAVIESSLNPNAINGNTDSSVDIGLMQINTYWYDKLPKTKKPKEEMLKNPSYAIAVAAWIVSQNTSNQYSWKTIGYYHSIKSKHRDKWLAKFKKALTELRKVDSNIKLERGFL